MTLVDIRQQPTPEFIADVRRRFPVEREMDRVLTRKMERRSGPGYTPIALSDLIEGTAALIRADIGDDFRLGNARWLTGGASKIQMAFDLEWKGREGGARRVTPMVLRMEPPESVVETSRRREFELIHALEGRVPVPPCFSLTKKARDQGHYQGAGASPCPKAAGASQLSAPNHAPHQKGQGAKRAKSRRGARLRRRVTSTTFRGSALPTPPLSWCELGTGRRGQQKKLRDRPPGHRAISHSSPRAEQVHGSR
jgi:hypothetical protein